MAREIFNTLYLTTQGAYLRQDHDTLVVEIEGEKRLQVLGHHLGGVVLFGPVMVSPGAIRWCADAGVSLTFLSPQGRFVGRLVGPISGNVLLRVDQFRASEDQARTAMLAKQFVAGKIQNTRQSVLRSARDVAEQSAAENLRDTAARLRYILEQLEQAEDMDTIRGLEGEAAHAYFLAFNAMMLQNRTAFTFSGRTRHPPRDPINALLSFLYALLLHDCRSALEGVGLDPQIGFLHALRPGRPSLALDLMEEFRAILADRVALTLVNRQQVPPADFVATPGGAVRMSDEARKTVVRVYQERKAQEVAHPLLDNAVPYGLLPHIQARLLARTLRGDLAIYPPFLHR
jgi:CRISPR-associated protein Cas1